MASLNTLQDQMKASGIVGKANGGTQVHPPVDPVLEVERLAMQKRIQELEAENAKLRQQSMGALRCKVSDKGAVSVYGLQKQFPVTLYKEQWERLFAHKPMIEDFIQLNKTKLTTKAKGGQEMVPPAGSEEKEKDSQEKASPETPQQVQ